MTWLTTGHGSFGSYFELRKIERRTNCECGEEAFTPDHLMTSCPLTAPLREEYNLRLGKVLGAAEPPAGWSNSDWFSGEEAFRVLVQYSTRLISACPQCAE